MIWDVFVITNRDEARIRRNGEKVKRGTCLKGHEEGPEGGWIADPKGVSLSCVALGEVCLDRGRRKQALKVLAPGFAGGE